MNASLNVALQQIRKQQHLSLREVGQPPLSLSSLSRFEQGETQLAGPQLETLVERLGLTSHDLSVLQFENQTAATVTVSKKVSSKLSQADYQGAEAAIQDYEKEAARRQQMAAQPLEKADKSAKTTGQKPAATPFPLPLAPLYAQALRARVALRQGQKPSQELLKPLVEHLTSVLTWYDFDYELLAYIGSALPISQAAECLAVARAQVKAHPLYAPSFMYCAHNMLLTALEHGQDALVVPLTQALQELDLREAQGFDPMSLLAKRGFAVALGQWRLANTSAVPATVKAYLKMCTQLEEPQLAARLRDLVAKMAREQAQ